MVLAPQTVEQVYRQEAGRILAALIASLHDFTLAEDAFQDAVVVALQQWPTSGIPRNPAAWLTTIARRKAIDRLRRDDLRVQKQELLARLEVADMTDTLEVAEDAPPIPDERLKLLFTCCHPALPLEARVALTLRTLGGLSTAEIAAAFLVPLPTMAQRLVRAQRKIHDARIPYRVPPLPLLSERMEGVLAVLYLIFNEGYMSTSGDALIRQDLCAEAIRLTRVLVDLIDSEPELPAEPEALGLLALMLLHSSRRAARVDAAGDLVLLEHQDRTQWNWNEIIEGHALLDTAMQMRRPGPYQIQAAISALHAEAPTADKTDWRQIALLYARLAKMTPSPVVELNQAVAVAMAEGPDAGLMMLERLRLGEMLAHYYPYHAARADLLRRAGRTGEASASYREALQLCQNRIERRFLQRRLTELATQTT